MSSRGGSLSGRAARGLFRRSSRRWAFGNQGWAPKAPVLILSVAKTHFSQNNTPNYYALFDLGAASALITLQAAALGLATHQMAGFDHDAARKALGIPEDYAMGSVMALGHQGEP